jgi:hypothetical protein
VRDLPGSCRVAHGALEEVAQPTGTALQVQCSSPAGLHKQNHFFEFPSPASINWKPCPCFNEWAPRSGSCRVAFSFARAGNGGALG